MDNIESKTQQEISTETTPAPETPTVTSTETQSTQTSKPIEGKDTTKSEDWEYTGDRKAVPDPFKKYVQGLDRYVSKKDQAAAELRKKAEEYDSFVNSENYKAYQAFTEKNPQSTGNGKAPDVPIMSQEEADAIAVGDTATLAKVIRREAQRNVEEYVGPKEAALQAKLQAVDMKQRQIESAEMIQSFAEVNPDFWDLYETGFEDYIVNSIKSGKSLEDTYKGAKLIESKTAERLETNRKTDLQKKKDGSVVGKSIPGTPDIVFADNEEHAKRLAIELTMKGDKRHVRIKPKK